MHLWQVTSILSSYSLLDYIGLLVILIWSFMMFVHITAIVFGKLYLYKFTPTKNANGLPGVSVIKPIVGADDNLYRNLQSFFELSYPKFEILFCIPHEKDPSVAVIRQLIETYPTVNAQIFTCAWNIGVNPKVNNMMQGYSVAKYDLIWICDSSIKVFRNTLLEMVSHLKPKVALVHQLPFVTNGNDFASSLEKVFFGTQHARVYLFANFLRLNCTNGMSNLIDKNVLEEMGGLRALSDYIAEDYHMSKTFWKRGYKLVLSSEPILQNPAKRTLSKYKERMLRWTRLRLTMEPLVQCWEPFTECFFIGSLMAWAVYHFTGRPMLLTLFNHVTVWFLFDQLLLHIVQGSSGLLPPFWYRAAAWLFRELYTFVIFLQAVFGRRVAWRNGFFKLSIGGKGELVELNQNHNENHIPNQNHNEITYID